MEMSEIPRIQHELKTIFERNFQSFPRAYETYLKAYWEKIFRWELETVKARACNDRILEGILDCGHGAAEEGPAMIIPIGQSYEPLVLAVHLVRPKVIFAVHTNEKHLEKFNDSLNKAASVISLDTSYSEKVKGIYLPSRRNIGEAALIFRLLRDPSKLHSDSKVNVKELQTYLKNGNVMFDITGAKKTISGGCFLYAAYYDIPIYYMDFDSDESAYHPDLGRPYPGRCFYTRQPSPISGFGLKRLRDIRKAFNERRFFDAMSMLDELTDTMKKGKKDGYFDDSEIQLYEGIKRVPEVYLDWQEGAYGKRGGKDLGKRLEEIASRLVKKEKDLFKYVEPYPPAARGKKYYNADYFEDTKAFCAYVCLELARLLRKRPLSNQNLFLRAFALEELLVGFIFWRLIHSNYLKFYTDSELTLETTLNDKLKKKFCSRRYGDLENFLIFSKETHYIFTGHEVSKTKFNGKLNSLMSVFEDENFASDNETVETFVSCIEQFRKNRQKRNNLVHFTDSASDADVDNLLVALNNIWEILHAHKPDWFVSKEEKEESVSGDIFQAIAKDNWYNNPPMAPRKYEEVEKIIKQEIESSSNTKDEEMLW